MMKDLFKEKAFRFFKESFENWNCMSLPFCLTFQEGALLLNLENFAKHSYISQFVPGILGYKLVKLSHFPVSRHSS